MAGSLLSIMMHEPEQYMPTECTLLRYFVVHQS